MLESLALGEDRFDIKGGPKKDCSPSSFAILSARNCGEIISRQLRALHVIVCFLLIDMFILKESLKWEFPVIKKAVI